MVGAPLVFLDCAVVNTSCEVQNLATDGRLAGIHVTDEHHVHVVPTHV